MLLGSLFVRSHASRGIASTLSQRSRRDIVKIMISIIALFPYVFVAYISNTMKYTILPNRISFKWGVFGKKTETIPFSGISTINLVNYDNSKKSTIYFGTNLNYKKK